MAMSAAAIRAGQARRIRPTSGFVVDDAAAKAASIRSCPECGSYRCKCRGVRRNKNGAVVRNWKCKDCGHSWKRKYSDGKPLVDARLLIAGIATHRECTNCKEALPLAEFSTCNGNLRHYCRKCSNKKRADNQLARTLAKFGISRTEHESAIKNQNGNCAICGKRPKGKGAGHYPFVIDHCHATGKFRGLLCDKCNLGLGNFNDDLTRMKSAVAYLEAFIAKGDA